MPKLRIAIPSLILVSILFISLGILQSGVLAQANAKPAGLPETAASSDPAPASGEESLAEARTPEGTDANKVIAVTSSGQPEINDPFYNQQWSLRQIRLPGPENQTRSSSPVLVAILDTGIDKNHADLAGKVAAEINLSGSSSGDDVYGHGTFVAGIISATTNNGIGIAGIAPESQLLDIKVADDQGRTQNSAVAQGIIWAVDHGANVINLSLELKSGSPELENAVNYAWEKGALIVSAISNSTTAPAYPAYYANSLSVAASDTGDKVGPLTGYGSWVSVAAPGFSIYSTLPDNSYGYRTGTSFAAAHVSGLAALLFSTAHDTNGDGRINDEVRAAIEKGAAKTANSSLGRIDAANSLALIK